MKSVLQRILDGQDHLCTHAGSSQYSDAGSSSACGLAAMNCVRHILSLEHQGTSGSKLVEQILLKETMEDIMSICSQWTSNAHLEVDDIYKTPLFQASLKLVRTDYGRAGKPTFEKMLSYLSQLTRSSDKRRSCAFVITRPPEIVTCLKMACPPRDLFIIFDSHPRPAHPDGAAFFLCGDAETAVRYLLDLFPVDYQLLSPDSGLQWQAELLAHVSGHLFEFSQNDMRMSRATEHAFMEANCAVLLAKVQENEALSRCSMLTSENKRLREDLDRLESQIEALRLKAAASAVQYANSNESKYNAMRGNDARRRHSPDPVPPSGNHEASRGDVGVPHSSGRFSGGFLDSIDMPFLEHNSRVFPLKQSISRGSAKGKGKAAYDEEDEDDLELAVRMQLELQVEDTELAAQRQLLQSTFMQETFDCNICMDLLPIDDVARLDGCDHLFCRNCIRQYISSKLEGRKFPIPCPCCAAQKDGGTRGTVSVALIHQIGISEAAYAIFNQLQITKFSIPIHCRRCNRSGFVDKQEFDQSKVLFCPFPTCSYAWCKDCQQEVSMADGPIHSCDGSEEFNHLLSQRGWKLCPGCKTPTEKTEGCNHMTCGSPGCNTHFCYVCGQLIAQSIRRDEINAQVANHYRANCPLFNVPPEN